MRREVQTEGMKDVLRLWSLEESWSNMPSAVKRQTEGRMGDESLQMVIRDKGEWIDVTETSFQP